MTRLDDQDRPIAEAEDTLHGRTEYSVPKRPRAGAAKHDEMCAVLPTFVNNGIIVVPGKDQLHLGVGCAGRPGIGFLLLQGLMRGAMHDIPHVL